MALTQVSTGGVKDGSLLNADINASAAISKSKIENLINNNADNRVITGSGTANTLEGESNLKFDGSRLGINDPNFANYNADCDDIIIQGSGNTGITINSGGTGNSFTGNIAFAEGNGTGGSADAFRGAISYKHNDDYMTFYTDYNERMRIDSSGRLLIGQTSGSSPLCVSGTNPVITELHHSDGGTNDQARISLGALANNPPSNRGVNLIAENNGAGHDFVVACSASHSAGPTEKMRILSNGDFEFDDIGTATPGNNNNTTGMGFEPRNGSIFLSRGDGAPLYVNTNTTNVDIVKFLREGTLRGRVFMQTTTVSYTTSSDYRLKENQVLISDGITRLKTLKPYRFNFIEEPSKTVDGFFAHEVTAVPEAVSGTKDAVDSDGNIEPQGLDYGRITPLLTAALQEAVAKIEVLEAKVAALEAA